MTEKRNRRRTPAERAAIVQQVLGAMCEGRSVREMARELKIARSRLMEWLLSDQYRYQYARAREEQGRAIAEEALELARGTTPETANAVRVTVDMLKWCAARMAPRDYGDRQRVEVSASVAKLDVERLPAEALVRIAAGENIAAVLADLGGRGVRLLGAGGQSGEQSGEET